MLDCVANTERQGRLVASLRAMQQPEHRRTASRKPFGTGALAVAECSACGRQAPLASNRVTAADELQVRCQGCGAVLAQVRSSPHTTWLDVRGIRRVPPEGPGDTSWGDA